jgi:hypothetical protein
MEWHPIITAPKDGTSVLLLMGGSIPSVGAWDKQPYHANPKPYWVSERGYCFGKAWDRANQPTHWMPFPESPKETVNEPLEPSAK